MKIAVLADDDGHIVAMAVCRMSRTGQVGTFTEDAQIRAEISRSALDAYRGRAPSSDPATAHELITSETIEFPEELHDMSFGDIRQEMVLDRSGPVPCLSPKVASS